MQCYYYEGKTDWLTKEQAFNQTVCNYQPTDSRDNHFMLRSVNRASSKQQKRKDIIVYDTSAFGADAVFPWTGREIILLQDSTLLSIVPYFFLYDIKWSEEQLLARVLYCALELYISMKLTTTTRYSELIEFKTAARRNQRYYNYVANNFSGNIGLYVIEY